MGRTTPGLGSYDSSQCLSPLANFAWGFVALGISGLLALVYVVHGGFQKVAFIRRERVVKAQADDYKKAFQELEVFFKEIIDDSGRDKTRKLVEEQRKWGKCTDRWNAVVHYGFIVWEILKLIFFFALSLVIISIATLLYVIKLFADVFFKSLIIWKQMHTLPFISFAILDYVAVIQNVISIVGVFLIKLSLPEFLRNFILLFFTPVILLFQVLANFRIDFSALNVTCSGAQAPLELTLNMIILGIVIVVIQSEYQVFSGLIFQSATLRYSEIVLSNEYISHQIGASEHVTCCASARQFCKKIPFVFFGLIYSISIQIIAQLVSFHSVLQFIMSGLRIESFAEVNGMHADSPACNQVEGYKGFDSILATLSTVLAYLILPAAFYEIAKVVCPRLNMSSEKLDKESKKKLQLSGRRSPAGKPSMAAPTARPSAEPPSTPASKNARVQSFLRGAHEEGETEAGREEEEAEGEGKTPKESGAGGEGEGEGEGDVEAPSPVPAPAPAPAPAPTYSKPQDDAVPVPDRIAVKDPKPEEIKTCWECAKVELRQTGQTVPDPPLKKYPQQYCNNHKIEDETKPTLYLTRENFIWLIKLPSTLLAPDLILALLSSGFPSSLPQKRKTRYKKLGEKNEERKRCSTRRQSEASRQSTAGQSTAGQAAQGSDSESMKHDASTTSKAWQLLRVRLVTKFRDALMAVWENAKKPLLPFPQHWKEESDYRKFQEMFYLPSYWTLLIYEYEELFPKWSKQEGVDAKLGKVTRGYFFKEPAKHPVGPFGLLCVLFLSITQLGHVFTSAGRLAMQNVITRYYSFLKVC